jgi:hypothetical protein
MGTSGTDGATGVHRGSLRESYRLAYVVGSGRSGSTILDMMLGAHSAAASLGQVDQLSMWVAGGDVCTCGAALDQCELWGTVLDGNGATSPPPSLNLDGQRRKTAAIVRQLIARPRSDRSDRDAAQTWEMLDRIAEHAGADVVVDSSKTLLRLLRLASVEARADRVHVIHLVRDVRGFTASRSTPTAAPAASGAVGRTRVQSPWRAVLDWVVQNVLTYVAGVTRLRGRYDVVRYEDLVREPEAVLTAVCGRVGLEFEPSMLPPLGRGAAHLIGGNSSRLRFDSLVPDTTWRSRLPVGRQRVLAVVQWPLTSLLDRRARRLTGARPLTPRSAP